MPNPQHLESRDNREDARHADHHAKGIQCSPSLKSDGGLSSRFGVFVRMVIGFLIAFIF
jgi:hypothetical protein